jgi:hypothetical protein
MRPLKNLNGGYAKIKSFEQPGDEWWTEGYADRTVSTLTLPFN